MIINTEGGIIADLIALKKKIEKKNRKIIKELL